MVCSPIHVGSGQVRCAHGILPVPAPATAHILRGSTHLRRFGTRRTLHSTGAALLKYFVNSFGPSPVMRVEKIGYGMGSKEFEAMNGVRALLGETEEAGGQCPGASLQSGRHDPGGCGLCPGTAVEGGCP